MKVTKRFAHDEAKFDFIVDLDTARAEKGARLGEKN
jgi:hypothetical protein